MVYYFISIDFQRSISVILVTGATGKVGSEVVRQLHSQGVSFTALAHSATSADKLTQQGVAVRRGDLSQPDTVRAALDGVQKLFLLAVNTPQQVEIESRVIDAAKQAGVKHIVKLSVYDAGKRIAAYKTHGSIEAHLKASGVPYTILQPNYFMQNFATSDAPTIIHNSALFAPLGDAHISFTDARDIAEVAAVVLTTSDHLNQTYEITGPTAYTYGEAAQMLSHTIGKTVQYVDLPSDGYREALLKAGLPDWYADILQELFADYHAGYGERVSENVERITGHAARTLPMYFEEHAAAFR